MFLSILLNNHKYRTKISQFISEKFMEGQVKDIETETNMISQSNKKDINMSSANMANATKRRNIPALAGIVHGVVVHTAKHRFGKSCSRLLGIRGAFTTLKMAYMLLETCPSGYYIETK